MDQLITFVTNHWVLSTLLGVLLVAFIGNEWGNFFLGSSKITPQEAVQLINHKEAIVLDIRNETLFTSGHILGALNIPSTLIEKKLNTLQKHLTKPLILISNTEQDCSKVASQLKAQGFLQVFLIQGGLQEWKRVGLPLVKK